MVTRQTTDSSDSGKGTNKGGDTGVPTLQTESPYQSGTGLADIKILQKTDSSKPSSVPEVGFTTVAEKGDKIAPKAETNDTYSDTGNKIAGMITSGGDYRAQTLTELRAKHPKLATEVEAVARNLSSTDPTTRDSTLKIMADLYSGLNPKPTDNRESKDALREAKLNPEMVPGVLRRASELVNKPPAQRDKEIKKLKVDVRGMYLDGGDL